jgi:hypothetical protein
MEADALRFVRLVEPLSTVRSRTGLARGARILKRSRVRGSSVLHCGPRAYSIRGLDPTYLAFSYFSNLFF